MNMIYGPQPDLSRYVTDCYKMGFAIPPGTGDLSIPVGKDSFVSSEKAPIEAETKEKKSHLGAILAGATVLLAGAALAFKPTREWAAKTLGKVGEKFGKSAIKKEADVANKAAKEAVSHVLENEAEPVTKVIGKSRLKGRPGLEVHCGADGKPITFTGDQVKHLEQVEGKKGVYRVSLGLREDGSEQYAEMTLKNVKNKKGEVTHYVTDVKKFEAGASNVSNPKVDVTPESTGTQKTEEVKNEVKPEPPVTAKTEEVKNEVKSEPPVTAKTEEVKNEVKSEPPVTSKPEEVKNEVKPEPPVTPKTEEVKNEVKPEPPVTAKTEEVKNEVKPQPPVTSKPEEFKKELAHEGGVDPNIEQLEKNFEQINKVLVERNEKINKVGTEIDKLTEDMLQRNQKIIDDQLIASSAAKVIRDSGLSKNAIKKAARKQFQGPVLASVNAYLQGNISKLTKEQIAFAENFVKELSIK